MISDVAKRILSGTATPAEAKEAEVRLLLVQQAQTTFWTALSGLENMLGIELESTDDFEGYEIETLITTKGKGIEVPAL